MTIFFKSHEITIYRHRRKGSTNRYGMSATFTSYHADIQPADRERQDMVAGHFGKTWTAFVEASTEIKEGDQVVDSTGKRYSVKGVSTWSNATLLDHKELIIVSIDG